MRARRLEVWCAEPLDCRERAGAALVCERYGPAPTGRTERNAVGPRYLLLTGTPVSGSNSYSTACPASYFDLDGTFGPTPYIASFDDQPDRQGLVLLGLNTDAQVGLLNFAASYGLTKRWEVTLNVPVVIVDAHASQTFSTLRRDLDAPPREARLAGPPIRDGNVAQALATLNNELAERREYALREESFDELGFQFNEGTNAGVGRIGLGAKGLVYSGRHLKLALSPELFFPSPNQAELAGPDSGAILPRLIAAVPIVSPATLHVDVGYDCDFDTDELRRFVWNVGASAALRRATFDAGLGGSKYNQGIEWSPQVVKGGRTANFPPSTLVAVGDTTLGDTYVDFLAGMKFRLADNWVISGAVDVPLNDEGLRPAAAGTLAVEFLFPVHAPRPGGADGG